MTTFYDEVVKQKTDTLAQTMSDMTYRYKETLVPKKHYKTILGTQIEEVISDSVAINMVNAYYSTMTQLNKGNHGWFVSAMIYIALGINPNRATQQEIDAVNYATAQVIEKKTTLINPEIQGIFKDKMEVNDEA